MPGERPTTVLVLAANPSDTARLHVDEELRSIREAIRRAKHRDAFRVVLAPAARLGDLIDALNEHEPAVVHFSGHGESAGIVMAGEDGASVEVSGDALRDAFASCPGMVRVVVLNACHSGAQGDAIARAVDCAVASDAAVPDESARSFAAAFYGALASGRSVASAVQQGAVAMGSDDMDDAAQPRIFPRKGVDPERLVLVPRSSNKKLVAVGAALAATVVLAVLVVQLWPEPSEVIEVAVRVQTPAGGMVDGVTVVRPGSRDKCVTREGMCRLALTGVQPSEEITLDVERQGYRLVKPRLHRVEDLAGGVTLLVEPTRIEIRVLREGKPVSGATVSVVGFEPEGARLRNMACDAVGKHDEACLSDSSNVDGAVFFYFEPPLSEIRARASAGLLTTRSERFRWNGLEPIELDFGRAFAMSRPTADPSALPTVRLPPPHMAASARPKGKPPLLHAKPPPKAPSN